MPLVPSRIAQRLDLVLDSTQVREGAFSRGVLVHAPRFQEPRANSSLSNRPALRAAEGWRWPFQVGDLLPPSEEWQLQPEVHDNNTYSLDVTFCGFKPDLSPGPHLWLAGRKVLWGTQVGSSLHRVSTR